MKEYPSIDTQLFNCSRVYVFDKLDGSCIRAEWTRKNKFCKFGSRSRLLGTDQEIIWKAEPTIQFKYSHDLNRIFSDQQYDKVTCFFEFFGPNSFAGNHKDEVHDVVLFDIAVERQGMMNARDFTRLFRGKNVVDIAELLWMGPLNQELVEKVKTGNMPGVTSEGVVCKGPPKGKKPQICKIKTNAWLERLKDHCGDDERLFEKLA